MPVRLSDSSRRSEISGIFLSRTRSRILTITPPSPPFLTMNGSSVTMIASLPWVSGSMCARARPPMPPPPGAPPDAAAAGLVRVADPAEPEDDAARGEVRPLEVLHEPLGGHVRVVDVGDGR